MSQNYPRVGIVNHVTEAPGMLQFSHRLTIGKIKVKDCKARMKERSEAQAMEMKPKSEKSNRWSARLKRCLEMKLQEIERKGFYQSVEQSGTHDLTGVHSTWRL